MIVLAWDIITFYSRHPPILITGITCEYSLNVAPAAEKNVMWIEDASTTELAKFMCINDLVIKRASRICFTEHRAGYFDRIRRKRERAPHLWITCCDDYEHFYRVRAFPRVRIASRLYDHRELLDHEWERLSSHIETYLVDVKLAKRDSLLRGLHIESGPT